MEGNEDSSCVFAPETYIVDFTQVVHPVDVKNSSWETQSVTGIEMITQTVNHSFPLQLLIPKGVIPNII